MSNKRDLVLQTMHSLETEMYCRKSLEATCWETKRSEVMIHRNKVVMIAEVMHLHLHSLIKIKVIGVSVV